MKKVLLVLMVILLGLSAGCGVKDDETAIQNTINNYYVGFKAEDVDKVAATFHEDYNDGEYTKSNLVAMLPLTFALVEIHSYSIVFESTDIVENIATVNFILTRDQTLFDARYENAVEMEFMLKKKGSKWLIISM